MAERISLNTGVKTYEIYDQENNFLGTFRFVPTDTDITKKYKEVKEYLASVTENMTEEDSIEMLNEVNAKIREKMDYLFNAPVSESFFRHAAPLTLLDTGESFVAHILDVLGQIIKKEVSEREEKQKKIIEKYTGKYTK